MKILLFGHRGQLGSFLAERLPRLGTVAAYDQHECDLADRVALRRVIEQERPGIIVNASAYTAVDQAESDAASAQRINADAPAVMAEAASAQNALLVHYSTDYVFDGKAHSPYTEESATHPQGVYARTKLAGEQAVAAGSAQHLILRTAWLYSNHGKNFFKTMLRLAEERTELRVVNDQTGSPTYARLVADTTLAMLEQMYAGGRLQTARCGLYHVACGGSATWHEFASHIIRLAGKANSVRVQPIPTRDYPTPAPRPAYSVLSSAKLEKVFGLRLPDWPTALEQCFADRAADR
jgi:dTDP-4-dehydrorhamnose reductase